MAGLYPEVLAGCRRGCRPGRDTPPPLSTRSAWSRYSEPRNLRESAAMPVKMAQSIHKQQQKDPIRFFKYANGLFTHRPLCCSSTRCSGPNRSLSRGASPQRKGRRGSVCGAASLPRRGCWDWSRTDLWVRALGSSRAPRRGAGRS